MPQKRAKRGSVKVENANGTLRLRFTHSGQRFVISLGLTDTAWHRHLAGERAFKMQRAIEFGEFRPDLIDQFRVQMHCSNQGSSNSTTAETKPLLPLWQQYSEVKRAGKSPATIRQYNWVEGHIQRLPVSDLLQAQAMLDAITKLKPGTQKTLLMEFSACCNWAMNSGLIDLNPFLRAAARVKVPTQGTVKGEIRPFSKAERDAIIAAFKASDDYHHYAALVAFLFFTGARPGEVIPMTWEQIGMTHILFDRTWVYSGKGYQLNRRLKTQISRRFPINAQLRGLIDSWQRGSSDALVFPSVEGKYINWSNFTRRAWKGVLESLPDVEYRKPYQMRHSFISYCREANLPSTTISEWVGNSAATIDSVYARSTYALSVPEL
jgi:integrase